MKNLIKTCVSRPVLVISSVIILFLAFVLSAVKMPLESLPEIDFPRVIVETKYQGLPAADIRRIITIPVEDALSAIKGLENISSVSRDGASIIQLDFRWRTNISSAVVLVRETIDSVYAALPQGVEKPSVIQSDPKLEAHVIIAVEAKTGGAVFERNFAEYEIRGRLRRIDGAGEILLSGGEKEEALVDIDIQRSIMRGIKTADAANLIAMESANIPAGNAREGGLELVVVSEGRPPNVDALSRLTLSAGGAPFMLNDISSVSTKSAKRDSIFIFNGKEMTSLEIFKRPGADPVKLSRDIQKLVKEANNEFSRDAQLHFVYDAAPGIVKSLAELGFSALLGALSVIFILVLFIKNIRYSILAAFSIPFSAAAAFSALALLGRSLNTMSLSGIALGVGLVSDTSVIILNVLFGAFGKNTKPPTDIEIAETVNTLSTSSFGGAATTIVVFVPVVFLPGVLGALFGDMAISIAVSVFSGWIYAQFILPSLFKKVFRISGFNKYSKVLIFNSRIFMQLQNILLNAEKKFEYYYTKKLQSALRNPKRLYIRALILSALGFVVLLTRPVSFVSKDAADEIEVSLVFPPGTLLEAAREESQKTAVILKEISGLENIFAKAGAEEEDVRRRSDSGYKSEEWTFRIGLSKNAPREKTLRAIKEKLLEVPAYIKTSAFFPAGKKEKILSIANGISYAAPAKNEKEARENGERAAALLAKKKGLSAVTLRPDGVQRSFTIKPRREILASLALSNASIAEAAFAATVGLVSAQLEIEGRPLDVRVKGAERKYSSPEKFLQNLPVARTENGAVFLGTVGQISEDWEESAFARTGRSDAVYIDIEQDGSLSGAALGRALAAAMPADEGFVRADETAFSKYRASLALTVALVVILLYLTMGAQFESWTLPLILMLSIPFALAGAGPALLLSNAALDSGALIGIVTLAGIVVNNGIVLYETSAERIAAGEPVVKAVYIGAKERLKPVTATTLTTAIVLLPLLVSRSSASQKPMAAAMFGGIIASTLLTLFALPAVFAFSFRKNAAPAS